MSLLRSVHGLKIFLFPYLNLACFKMDIGHKGTSYTCWQEALNSMLEEWAPGEHQTKLLLFCISTTRLLKKTLLHNNKINK